MDDILIISKNAMLLHISFGKFNLVEIVFSLHQKFLVYRSPDFLKDVSFHVNTAIPYRASTGPEQGFPCVVNSHREKPVFITGNPCSHCRDPVFITGNSL